MNLEDLVGVAGGARPDLELDAVGGGTVGHVEALVVERLDLACNRGNGDAPGDVAIGESRVEVGIETRDESNLGAVRIRRRSDTEGAASKRRSWVSCGLRTSAEGGKKPKRLQFPPVK